LPLLIAQISDLHVDVQGQLLFGRIDTAARLTHCIQHIARLPVQPALIVASGDLVNRGTIEEYRVLRERLAPLTMPVYLMPGNHDERTALRNVFPDHTYLPSHGTLHYSVDVEDLRLIMLDTVIPGEGGGGLDAAQLDWLDQSMAARSCMIFMHHPPFATGVSYMDEIALDAADGARFAAVVSRHRFVQRISCGHVHRAVSCAWNGTVAGVCPSSAFQYNVELRPDGVPSPTEEQPAYQLHYWDGGVLATHTVQIENAD
jgi:Icc protein